ncbi:MAG: MFS transporter [Chloroflexi bacterium]|nr:MAG: MFS transporter [Chloroflexota bacterium]
MISRSGGGAHAIASMHIRDNSPRIVAEAKVPAMQTRSDLAEYATALRSFSRNARLFIAHVIGMDTVHGTSLVLVNLYFLAVGLSIEFIGLRLLLAGIAGAIFSVPAGLISDRIGRKWSFIIGDGVGAALYVITIFSVDQTVLIVTGVLAAIAGTLHGVSEPAFMAENSEPRERVHLFSVATGLRTLSAMVGSLLGGFVPVLAASLADKVTLYRASIFIGIFIWALSLIPALMLRGKDRPTERAVTGLRDIFGAVRHRARVAQLVAVSAIVAFGFGFVGPLFNVFFYEGLHAHTHDRCRRVSRRSPRCSPSPAWRTSCASCSPMRRRRSPRRSRWRSSTRASAGRWSGSDRPRSRSFRVAAPSSARVSCLAATT